MKDLISHKTQNLKFKTQNKNKTNIYFYVIKNKNPYYTIVLFISNMREKRIGYELVDDRCAVCSEGSRLKGGKVVKKRESYTCYSLASLRKIAKAMNMERQHEPGYKKIPIDHVSKYQLWKTIQEHLKPFCDDDEECWRRQEFIKKLKDIDIQAYTFKPHMPESWKRDKNTWLNNFDIDIVLKQYEKIYPEFKTYNASPSDCPVSVECPLSNLDPFKLRKAGKTKIGIVFNLDKTGESGSHWVATFIDLKSTTKSTEKDPVEINYYDSYGDPPIPLIKLFLVRLGEKFLLANEKVKILYNDKRHQYGNSECGVYSMNFILERLHGTPMKKISKTKIMDKDMNLIRRLLYYVR